MSESITKRCSECGKDLPLVAFYRNTKMHDGLLNRCKNCQRAHQRAYRERHVVLIRRKDSERSKLKHRVEYRRNRQQMRKATDRKYASACCAVRHAIERGEMTRPDACSVCGIKCRPGAHHDDHAKPLDIMWLCPVCHAHRHLELGLIKTGDRK